jgi:hypothetical protein
VSIWQHAVSDGALPRSVLSASGASIRRPRVTRLPHGAGSPLRSRRLRPNPRAGLDNRRDRIHGSANNPCSRHGPRALKSVRAGLALTLDRPNESGEHLVGEVMGVGPGDGVLVDLKGEDPVQAGPDQ